MLAFPGRNYQYSWRLCQLKEKRVKGIKTSRMFLPLFSGEYKEEVGMVEGGETVVIGVGRGG